MKNLETFLETLSDFTKGRTELNAVFVTYNEVGGHNDGSMNTGKLGLNIVVQNGNLEYSPFCLAALMIGLGSGNIGLAIEGGDTMEREARGALGQVQDKLSGQFVQFNLAVVYAGLSAFQESLDYARKIRKSNPQCKVVVLTCDCDPRMKELVLAKALENGEIDEAIMTSECGGYYGMREILDGFVAAWPN